MHRRDRDAVRGVDRAARLRVGARVVDDRAVAADDDANAHRHRLARLAVALHHVLEDVVAVGDRLDPPPHQPLAVREQLVPDGERERRAVAVEQRRTAAVGELEQADHRVQVAPRGRRGRAVVGEDDLPDVLDRLAARGRASRAAGAGPPGRPRSRSPRTSRRCRPPISAMWPIVAAKATQLALVEHRQQEHVLRHVAAAAERVVVETTSPGSNESAPSSSSTQRTDSPSAPRCAGLNRPCATIRPPRSRSAREVAATR